MEILSLVLQFLALVFFLALVWPHIKKENWKEKFIDNKAAFSLLIVFIIILVFVTGISVFFDILFPVERLDQ